MLIVHERFFAVTLLEPLHRRARTKLNVNTREGSLGDREVKCEIEVLGFDVVRSGK